MEISKGNELPLAEKTLAFMQTVSGSSDLNALVRVTATLLGNPVSLIDAEEQLLACHPVKMQGENIKATDDLNQAMAGIERAEESLIVEEYGDCGRLSVYAVNAPLSEEDRTFIFLAARAIAIIIRPQIGIKVMTQLSKLQLMRKLLSYKPGLRAALQHDIQTEHLDNLGGPFRVLFIHVDDDKRAQIARLRSLIGRHLRNAWSFIHGEDIVCVFNEAIVLPRDYMTALNDYLAATRLTACLSMPFKYLIDLRRMFEVAQASWPAARKQDPGTRLHQAMNYQVYAFLGRCAMHFNPADYCPDGLYRLIEADRETGRDDLETLYAYIENGFNANAAAREMHIHRNTLINRLERIQEILGLPLDDRDVVLFLRLCFRILEMQQ
ncbi:MAG: PucR family transcriptional regulator [Fretibacterium sp.]|nr:PucR family transcriptional regulator [Fretibacterium sp.]